MSRQGGKLGVKISFFIFYLSTSILSKIIFLLGILTYTKPMPIWSCDKRSVCGCTKENLRLCCPITTTIWKPKVIANETHILHH